MLRIVLFCLSSAACFISQAAEPALVKTSPLKHLMLDTRVIQRSVNARVALGKVTKEKANPVFQADKPWENSLNNLYPNVLWDEQDHVFKMWYKCVLADKEAIAQMDAPSTVHDVGWYLLYATSKDGVHWEKPALGLHKFNGDAATNIVARDCPNVGVFKDMHEADPSRRYKMVHDVGLGKPRVRFSPDGIHWGETLEVKGFTPQQGDTHNNAFFDDATGKYVWFTKLYLGERLASRLESTDFINWKNNGLVLRSSVTEGRRHQVYCLPVFRYGAIYLGYAMIYNVGVDRSVDCELAWSPDGLTWQRVAPGKPFIPRGEGSAYDSKCIYAMAGPAVEKDGQLMVFYGGDDFPHTGWKRNCLPCLARLPVDRFAGYEQEDKAQPATLFSSAFLVGDESAKVSADASGGMIRIAVLDELGIAIDEAEAITSNVTDQPLKWKTQGLTRHKGIRVHFQFELTGGARLYALDGLEMANKALPTPLNPLRSPHRKPAPIVSRMSKFDKDAEGWKGTDTLQHIADGGFIRVSRKPGQIPIAYSSPEGPQATYAGNWPEVFGGNGARITCKVRAPKNGGEARVEIFAGDTAQWYCERGKPLTTDWEEAVAELRYNWTDEEATKAGWRRATHAWSWSETITHVGKLVITPGSAAAQSSFDVDEVTVSGVE